MNRRDFLLGSGAASIMAAGFVMSPEGWWLPGHKTISLPKTYDLEICMSRLGKIVDRFSVATVRQFTNAGITFYAKQTTKHYDDVMEADEILVKNPYDLGPSYLPVTKEPIRVQDGDLTIQWGGGTVLSVT